MGFHSWIISENSSWVQQRTSRANPRPRSSYKYYKVLKPVSSEPDLAESGFLFVSRGDSCCILGEIGGFYLIYQVPCGQKMSFFFITAEKTNIVMLLTTYPHNVPTYRKHHTVSLVLRQPLCNIGSRRQREVKPRYFPNQRRSCKKLWTSQKHQHSALLTQTFPLNVMCMFSFRIFCISNWGCNYSQHPLNC